MAEEFSSLYVFHLRGNQRTSGEQSRKEGGKIFGSGSRAPIAISLLVKNPQASEHGKIYFHDIGDYLSQKDKLEKITEFGSIDGITAINGWQSITPDVHGDWVNQRDDSFGEHISLGDKKDKSSVTVFENYSNGVKTNRDAWVYNTSKSKLIINVNKSINFYNSEVQRYIDEQQTCEASEFVRFDSTKFSWDAQNKWDLEKGRKYTFEEESLQPSLYRPFTKQNLYFHANLNNRRYQMPKIFPNGIAENRVISVTGRGATKEFSTLMTDTVPDLEMISKGQCFPLNIYEGASIGGTERNGTERKLYHRTFKSATALYA